VCRIATGKGRNEVAFRTKLAVRYWLKTIIMVVVCIVLGLWGIWDYAVAIPRDARDAARADTLRIVKNGLDTPMGSKQRTDAVLVLVAAIEDDDLRDVLWSNSLEVMRVAVGGGNIDTQKKAMRLVEDGLNKYGKVTTPSKYDRPMQWMFIACLPFGVYYVLVYAKMSKRAKVYLLTDDGVLTTPEGTWSPNEIVDIDMSRWMAKKGNARSTWTAKVVLGDGSTVLLDDYIYKDMHYIIGKLAHGFYPDEWTPVARRTRTSVDGEDTQKEQAEPLKKITDSSEEVVDLLKKPSIENGES